MVSIFVSERTPHFPYARIYNKHDLSPMRATTYTGVNIHDSFIPLYIGALQQVLHHVEGSVEFETQPTANPRSILNERTVDFRLNPASQSLGSNLRSVCKVANDLLIILLDESIPSYNVASESMTGYKKHIEEAIERLKRTSREGFGFPGSTVMVQSLGNKMTALDYVQKIGLPAIMFYTALIHTAYQKDGSPWTLWTAPESVQKVIVEGIKIELSIQFDMIIDFDHGFQISPTTC